MFKKYCSYLAEDRVKEHKMADNYENIVVYTDKHFVTMCVTLS